MHDQAVDAIRRQLERDPTSECVFGGTDYRRARADALKTIGYDQTITLRDLRHTWATLALAASHDPWATMAALGHADLRTTSIYQSTTIERASAVGDAGARAVLGTGAPATGAPDVSVVGAAGFELAAPSSQSLCSHVLQHASTCNHCLDAIATALWDRLVEARDRSTRPEQVA